MVQYNYYEDRYVDVNGIRTRYWDEGEGPETALLVHGLGGSVEIWACTIPHLCRRMRTVALDVVGFGRTGKPDGAYTYPFFAAFLRDFVRVMGLDRFHLFGHSLGGGIALQFVSSYPGLAERLVLVGSGGLGRQFSQFLRLLTLPGLGEYLTRPTPKRPEEALNGLVFDPSICDEVVAGRINELAAIPGNRESILRTLRANATVFNGTARSISGIHLEGIDNKSLVFWGDRDEVIPFRYAEPGLKKLRNHELVMYRNCGHCPMIELADDFNARVDSFLE